MNNCIFWAAPSGRGNFWGVSAGRGVFLGFEAGGGRKERYGVQILELQSPPPRKNDKGGEQDSGEEIEPGPVNQAGSEGQRQSEY